MRSTNGVSFSYGFAAVVQYRFFGGLTSEEIGEVLGVTPRTVDRDWTKARMLLKLELMV